MTTTLSKKPDPVDPSLQVPAVPGIWAYSPLKPNQIRWYRLRTPLSLKGTPLLSQADLTTGQRSFQVCMPPISTHKCKGAHTALVVTAMVHTSASLKPEFVFHSTLQPGHLTQSAPAAVLHPRQQQARGRLQVCVTVLQTPTKSWPPGHPCCILTTPPARMQAHNFVDPYYQPCSRRPTARKFAGTGRRN